MKIGIYGGSFNPPHLGHIQAAEAAAEKLKLDKLLIIPAGIPPHKKLPEGTPEREARIEMSKIAFSKIPCAEVLDYEMNSAQPSYTAHTLSYLKGVYPDGELYLFMGTDMFLTLDKWHDSQTIFKLAVPVVFARKPEEYSVIEKAAAELKIKFNTDSVIISLVPFEAASSEIRTMLPNRQGEEFLPDDVYAYIVKNRYYSAKPSFEWLRRMSYSRHKPGRIPHVKGCEEEAVRLAERWGADTESAREAGILHDITKKLGLAEQLLLCEKYGILTDSLEKNSEKLLHSKTGAALSRDLFGISDDVYDAIFWHTTGKANMSLLEKVLYLADYIEPNRDFDGVEPLRKLCYEDLDSAMALGLKMSVDDLNERGVPIHPRTSEALKFYENAKG